MCHFSPKPSGIITIILALGLLLFSVHKSCYFLWHGEAGGCEMEGFWVLLAMPIMEWGTGGGGDTRC